MGYRGKRAARFRRAAGAGALALAGALLWCAWGLWSSCHDPVVRRWQVPLPGISQPVRLAVLSDLHDWTFGDGNDVLEELTAAQEPDFILLDGDLLNADSKDSRRVCALVQALRRIAPVYYAWGNHELVYLERGTSPLKEELEAAGALVLDREYTDLEVRGSAIRLGGLYDYAFARDDTCSCDPAHMDPDVVSFLREFQDTERCRILLSHRPDSFVFGAASATWGVDLVISGHDHGGQVVLPLLGGIWGGDQGLFPAYVHGLYEKDAMRLAITSGLGTQRESLPRFRNPPEIMILELESAA